MGHGKVYKNYKAMLLNALIRDFGVRKVSLSVSLVEPELTPEQKARANEKLAEIRAKFYPGHSFG